MAKKQTRLPIPPRETWERNAALFLFNSPARTAFQQQCDAGIVTLIRTGRAVYLPEEGAVALTVAVPLEEPKR